MKQTRVLMGMPITVELVGAAATSEAIDDVFAYFTSVDERFSTYKAASEISRINSGELGPAAASADMQSIFRLAEQTRLETGGYFNIAREGRIDPSGIVKGWAIHNAAARLRATGLRSFYIEAGGDIQADGQNREGRPWRVGIRNPFDMGEIVKVVALSDRGIATSGIYIRGQHIYNPYDPQPAGGITPPARPCRSQEDIGQPAGETPARHPSGGHSDNARSAGTATLAGTPSGAHSAEPGCATREIVSLSVIGPNIYDADRFATAAFAMGPAGIVFIEQLPGFEAYMIDARGIATFTSGFQGYVAGS